MFPNEILLHLILENIFSTSHNFPEKSYIHFGLSQNDVQKVEKRDINPD